ncbi:hypothetical protein B4U80_13818 [Leptotrombidium deliense]|uniref:Uncharacterized protein n=1 Tax=Leptotrombidium deliense TaxID=299467 RepID=A0A443SCL5_9ACAR|nr:hypothetical protein B4U80_13818 [Leptotrombidium deliense]
MALRQKLYSLTKSGQLKHCSVTCSITCEVNNGPIAEYPIANFGMCCNMSSAAEALAFLSKNRGDLSVFVHPTTLHPFLDHSKRGIWLGPSMPFDFSSTPIVRDPARVCN